MASAVIAVAAAVAGAGVKAYLGATLMASIIGAVVATGLNYIGNAILGEGAENPGIDDFDAGMLSNKSSADANIPVVYGYRLMGGTRVLVRSTGTNNEYLHIVLPVCHGPIEGFDTIYLDGIESTDSKFSGLVTINEHLGADDQLADSDLVSAVSEWTDDHRLRGVAYLYVKIKYDREVFSSIPVITTLVQGINHIYDPRDESTGWSDNPALIVRDYCTNSRYGRGIPTANFPDAYVIAEANYCDATVSKGGGSATRYTCNGAIDTAQSMLDNTRALLSSMRGVLVFSGGQYKLHSDRITASTYSFNEDNINIERITMKLGSLSNTYNLVEAKFFNPDEDSQYDYAQWDDTTARTSDNERELKQTVELKFTNDYYTALQIATLTGKASRQPAALELTVQPEGLQCEVWDVVDLTMAQYGFDEKLFRITGAKLLEDNRVQLSLLEYDDGAYDFGTISFKAARARTSLPSPLNPAAPTSLALTSGTGVLFLRGDGTVASRIKASWTAPADIFVTDGGEVEVQYKESADSDWIFWSRVSGDVTQEYITDVQDAVEYDLRIRSINVNGYTSAWVTVSNHSVVGKTEEPSDVANLTVQQNGEVVTFSWPQVTDLDLSGYEIRFAAQGAFTWAGASVLTSTTKGTRITTAAVPPGDWTFGIKAVDTSGNYSINAEATNARITNANDIAVSLDKHPEWLGTLSNCLIHPVSRFLAPLSTSQADELGWEVFDRFVPDPEESFAYTAAEIDLGFDSRPRVYADIDAAIGPTETTGSADPQLYVRTKEDGGDWSEYAPWSVAYASCRYIQAKIAMETATGVGLFSAMSLVVDLPERSEKSNGAVTIPSGGLNVLFDQQFHGVPNIILTAKGTDNLIPKYTNESSTGFTYHLIDPSTSSGASGEGSWRAVGA